MPKDNSPAYIKQGTPPRSSHRNNIGHKCAKEDQYTRTTHILHHSTNHRSDDHHLTHTLTDSPTLISYPAPAAKNTKTAKRQPYDNTHTDLKTPEICRERRRAKLHPELTPTKKSPTIKGPAHTQPTNQPKIDSGIDPRERKDEITQLV